MTNSNKQIFLFTHPRTASNLLVRILNLEHQPALRGEQDVDLDKFEYFFMQTMPLRMQLVTRHQKDWTKSEIGGMRQRLQSSADAMMRYSENAIAEGKNVFVKEHLMWMLSPEAEDLVKVGPKPNKPFWKVGDSQKSSQDRPASPEQEVDQHQSRESEEEIRIENQTVFPDDFLLAWTPTFLIRHPAMVFPSLYRTALDISGRKKAKDHSDGKFCLEMTWRWSRSLWEWYEQKFREGKTKSRAIILDADDVILKPEVINRYCEAVGLDAEKCTFEWKLASAEEVNSIHFAERRMKSSLLFSSGVLKEGKVAVGLDLEQEAQQWIDEFGEEEAKKLADSVEAAMPDYEYMRERRLTA